MRATTLVMMLTSLLGVDVLQAQTPETKADAERRVIVTLGRAVVHRAPDRAFVVLATEVRAPQPAEAQRRAAELMTAVQQRLRQHLPQDAIRTLAYSIQEEFEYVDNRRVSRGYRVSNTIEVRVDDLDRVGQTIDVAVAAGATTVSHVRFDLKDRETAERDALRQAVANAAGRAEAAAAGADVRLGDVLRIDEQVQVGPLPVMQRTMMEARAPETPIEAGEIEIEATVTLTTGIR